MPFDGKSPISAARAMPADWRTLGGALLQRSDHPMPLLGYRTSIPTALAGLLIALVLMCRPALAVWSQGNEMLEAMSHMVRMWNDYNQMRQWTQMGEAASARAPSPAGMSPWAGAMGPAGMTAMPGMSGMPGALPNGPESWGGLTQPWQTFEDWRPSQWIGPQRSERGLDGIWRSASGEAILIRQGQFRILGLDGSQSDGIFMTYRDRMIAYMPATDITRKYQFTLEGDRLALQDEAGQLMVFQRESAPLPPPTPW